MLFFFLASVSVGVVEERELIPFDNVVVQGHRQLSHTTLPIEQNRTFTCKETKTMWQQSHCCDGDCILRSEDGETLFHTETVLNVYCEQCDDVSTAVVLKGTTCDTSSNRFRSRSVYPQYQCGLRSTFCNYDTQCNSPDGGCFVAPKDFYGIFSDYDHDSPTPCDAKRSKASQRQYYDLFGYQYVSCDATHAGLSGGEAVGNGVCNEELNCELHGYDCGDCHNDTLGEHYLTHYPKLCAPKQQIDALMKWKVDSPLRVRTGTDTVSVYVHDSTYMYLVNTTSSSSGYYIYQFDGVQNARATALNVPFYPNSLSQQGTVYIEVFNATNDMSDELAQSFGSEWILVGTFLFEPTDPQVYRKAVTIAFDGAVPDLERLYFRLRVDAGTYIRCTQAVQLQFTAV